MAHDESANAAAAGRKEAALAVPDPISDNIDAAAVETQEDNERAQLANETR